MKYKSVLLIAVFVCIAQLFYGQERYTIRGEFPDHSLDNEYVLLYDRSALQGESERLKEAFIDSILVVDKVFHYEGTIDRKPFLASIYCSKGRHLKYSTTFIIEPGNVRIRITDWENEGDVLGTPINDDYNTYIIERGKQIGGRRSLKTGRGEIKKSGTYTRDDKHVSFQDAYKHTEEGRLRFLEKYAQYPDVVRYWLALYIDPTTVFGGFVLYCTIAIWFTNSIKVNMFLVGIVLIAICFLQAVLGLLQYFTVCYSPSIYKITGSFDNPAGFSACLCIGLPFIAFLLLKDNKRYIHLIGWIMGIIIIVAIILSYSRAGIISLATISTIFLYQRLDHKRMLRFFLLAGLVALILGCYWMKKDSADGRLLIWQSCINMVKDSPWMGHGLGSFEAHYMDYQAEYFRIYGQQNRYAMLADNVKHPFNEYMGILLNFGIIGLLILCAFIFLLIYCYKLNSTIEKKIALYTLISIGIFSLFSYPFTYPFTWIITFLSVLIIIREPIEVFFTVSWRKNIACAFAIVCSMIGIYKLVERTQAELEWGRISKLTFSDSYNEALPVYEELEKVLVDDPYFLYNYAAVLLEKKQYNKSLEIALQCRKYWADYDLELLIGESYQQLNNFDMAEKYYNSASMMCPSRFLPLYKLFYLYKSNNKIEKVLDVADLIINKPMKIKTSSILMMKKNVKNAIVHIKRGEYTVDP